MDRFLQLHLLTAYPPSNLNRDDTGRPKVARMGGRPRLRISSQSLKRAWRKSDVFEEALAGHLGTRTKEMGRKIFNKLNAKGVTEGKAHEWAGSIAAVFGKRKGVDGDKPLQDLDIEQLAHFGPSEEQAIQQLVDTIAERGSGPEDDELKLLDHHPGAVDIALFGRMLAASPAHGVEAAAQVAHAITVNEVQVEDDFFTAVDDLNQGIEDMGAGHMGETEFAAGLFYQYLCIDRHLLVDNLQGDEELAKKAIAALTEAAATVAPTGKQASFASRARASYILAETGNQQPRTLSVAFLEPIRKRQMLTEAIGALEDIRSKMDQVYGSCASAYAVLNAHEGTGSLGDVIRCATE